eukprot:CFRG0208T1
MPALLQRRIATENEHAPSNYSTTTRTNSPDENNGGKLRGKNDTNGKTVPIKKEIVKSQKRKRGFSLVEGLRTLGLTTGLFTRQAQGAINVDKFNSPPSRRATVAVGLDAFNIVPSSSDADFENDSGCKKSYKLIFGSQISLSKLFSPSRKSSSESELTLAHIQTLLDCVQNIDSNDDEELEPPPRPPKQRDLQPKSLQQDSTTGTSCSELSPVEADLAAIPPARPTKKERKSPSPNNDIKRTHNGMSVSSMVRKGKTTGDLQSLSSSSASSSVASFNSIHERVMKNNSTMQYSASNSSYHTELPRNLPHPKSMSSLRGINLGTNSPNLRARDRFNSGARQASLPAIQLFTKLQRITRLESSQSRGSSYANLAPNKSSKAHRKLNNQSGNGFTNRSKSEGCLTYCTEPINDIECEDEVGDTSEDKLFLSSVSQSTTPPLVPTTLGLITSANLIEDGDPTKTKNETHNTSNREMPSSKNGFKIPILGSRSHRQRTAITMDSSSINTTSAAGMETGLSGSTTVMFDGDIHHIQGIDFSSLLKKYSTTFANEDWGESLGERGMLNVAVLGARRSGKTSLVQRFSNGLFNTMYDPTIAECTRHSVQLSNSTCSVQVLDSSIDDWTTARTPKFGNSVFRGRARDGLSRSSQRNTGSSLNQRSSSSASGFNSTSSSYTESAASSLDPLHWAHGYILMFAADDPKSFEQVVALKEELVDRRGRFPTGVTASASPPPIIVVGTKMDTFESTSAGAKQRAVIPEWLMQVQELVTKKWGYSFKLVTSKSHQSNSVFYAIARIMREYYLNMLLREGFNFSPNNSNGAVRTAYSIVSAPGRLEYCNKGVTSMSGSRSNTPRGSVTLR